MEKQEIGLKLGEKYEFVPAQRNDTNEKTGRPRYFVEETCEDNCDPNRNRRDVFANLGAMHSIMNLEDLNITDRKKRSEFTDGLIKAGGKLLDGSPGGFFVEMLKTIAKPVYNWVIGTDNDEVMKKFTKRMLPETQFRGHHEEYQIASHADEGDGAAVWTTLSQNSLQWDPKQHFEDSSNIVHLQCR